MFFLANTRLKAEMLVKFLDLQYFQLLTYYMYLTAYLD